MNRSYSNVFFRHSHRQTQSLRGSAFFSWSVSSSFPCAAYFDANGSQAAKDTSSSKDKLIDVFNRIERFFGRLEIYTSITPTTAMTAMIIDIMVEVLTILGIATKEVKRGGLSELISHRSTILD